MPRSSCVFRIAHRGASSEAPENTLPAIRLAVDKYRVDMVEFDIRLSRDGTPVLIHDETLERTTNGTGRVRDHDLPDLKRLRVINRAPAGGPPETTQPVPDVSIPTLEEVLREFPDTAFCIEIKEKEARAGEKVLEAIRKVPRSGPLVVGSFHFSPIQRVRKEKPESVETTLTRREVVRAWLLFRLGLKKFNSPARFASLPRRRNIFLLDDPAWIDFLHRSGVRVFYWTINQPEEAEELVRRGADGIVSDVLFHPPVP